MNYTEEQQKGIDIFKARIKAAREQMKKRAEERKAMAQAHKVKCEHPDLDLLHPTNEQLGTQG